MNEFILSLASFALLTWVLLLKVQISETEKRLEELEKALRQHLKKELTSNTFEVSKTERPWGAKKTY